MAKYIDAEALKELFADSAALCNDIDEFPAADVRENRHGEWKHDKDDVLISGYCSHCGWLSIIMETDVADMPYCPNCGADMRT